MLCFASFRLTRLIVFDEITSFIRHPFHDEVTETEEDGTVSTYLVMKGTGIKRWFGELISCYWCTGIWSSAFLYITWNLWPTIMEPVIIILAIAGIAAIIETFTLQFINQD
ncbi:DUF1360 domain-containing protein [Bacillus sp. BGMRC 2118]|nr:DUF1360 domain-containing protein [Bacillus sp. BGMRC 2118]